MKRDFFIRKWQSYKSRKRWWSIMFDFLFLLLILAMVIPVSRRTMSSFVVRQTLISPRESAKTIFLDDDDWQFSVMSYDGEFFNLKDFEGKPVFINYWATWCPPCIAELPSIQNLYNQYRDKVHFIFISNENPDVVKAFMERRGYDLPLYAHAGPVPDAFESSVLPTTFVIGTGGRIVLYKTGAARWDSKKVFRLMDRLSQQ